MSMAGDFGTTIIRQSGPQFQPQPEQLALGSSLRQCGEMVHSTRGMQLTREAYCFVWF
jgi:hypothetical protein